MLFFFKKKEGKQTSEAWTRSLFKKPKATAGSALRKWKPTHTERAIISFCHLPSLERHKTSFQTGDRSRRYSLYLLADTNQVGKKKNSERVCGEASSRPVTRCSTVTLPTSRSAFKRIQLMSILNGKKKVLRNYFIPAFSSPAFHRRWNLKMQNPPGFSNNDLSAASEVPRTADLRGRRGLITDGRLLPLKKTNIYIYQRTC